MNLTIRGVKRASRAEAMTRRSYMAFGDIEGKLAMLHVKCTRCRRAGSYSVAKLIATYGRNGNMSDWAWRLKQDCPWRSAPVVRERYDLICPDLPKVV
jgi:hypothetical protein